MAGILPWTMQTFAILSKVLKILDPWEAFYKITVSAFVETKHRNQQACSHEYS